MVRVPEKLEQQFLAHERVEIAGVGGTSPCSVHGALLRNVRVIHEHFRNQHLNRAETIQSVPSELPWTFVEFAHKLATYRLELVDAQKQLVA